MVVFRLGERDADGRRLGPEIREWTYTSRPSRDLKGKKEEVFTNASSRGSQPVWDEGADGNGQEAEGQ